MSYDLKQEPLQLKKNDSIEVNKDEFKKVADKAALSENLVVKAAGDAGVVIYEAMEAAITRKEDANAEVTNSVVNAGEKNDAGVDGYAAMVKAIFDELGGDVEALIALLIAMSKAHTTDGSKPGKAWGGSAVQSEEVGKALMHFHKIAHATFYKIWFSTNVDPSVMSAYSRCTPDTFTTSHGGLVNVATGVKIWFRIQACNTHGDGIMSDPFGGISFSPTI